MSASPRTSTKHLPDCDSTAALELEDSLVSQHPNGTKDRVLVHPEDGGEVSRRWELLAWLRLAIGDRATYVPGDLIVEQRRVCPVDLDTDHGASDSSARASESTAVTVAPAQRPDVVESAEALIKEARRRARRRRLIVAGTAVVAAAGFAVGLSLRGPSVSFRGPTRIGPGGPVVDTSAIRDEGTLAFVSQTTLYVIEGSTGAVGKVTAPGIPSNPLLSPDGRWLAFVESGPQIGSAGLAESLWIANGTGGDPIKVTVVGAHFTVDG
jgi:hypothetical protein